MINRIKLFAVLSLIPFLTFAQGKYGQPEAGSGGISTATARQNTGWTSNGTTAQDTSATYYLINGKYQRLILVDTDNDSLILAPHALYPINLKDGTTVLFQVDSTGRVGVGGAVNTNYGLVVSGGISTNIAAASYEVGNGGSGTLQNTSSGSSIVMIGGGAFGGGIRFNAAASGNRTDRSFWFQTGSDTLAAFGLGSANKGYYSFGNGIKPQSQNQAIFTIRPAVPVSDTLFMARNDKNSILDSTAMVFANGSGYFGGNNLYLGGNRIRSTTGDTILVIYAGTTTQAFAILADGSTADLVAGTPPSSRRYIPPPDYIWLLRIGVLLLLLLVAFKVHDYIYKADEMKWKIIRSGIRGK